MRQSDARRHTAPARSFRERGCFGGAGPLAKLGAITVAALGSGGGHTVDEREHFFGEAQLRDLVLVRPGQHP